MATISFEPKVWLASLAEIGGGYALMSGRKLFLTVDRCDAEDLTAVMSQIVGHADRQEAIKRAIEDRQNGRVAA